ncbi:hypothetical protein JQN58_05420 [Aneurinibacillus sp. BA2021]|nr:hypothetical protein [Aneurinibacillus sp. BA2021]
MQLNSWHVFEHLKRVYMATGQEMTIGEVKVAFKNSVTQEEIEEGIAEFCSVVHSMPLPQGQRVS